MTMLRADHEPNPQHRRNDHDAACPLSLNHRYRAVLGHLAQDDGSIAQLLDGALAVRVARPGGGFPLTVAGS
jgi:hypothetical protein